MRLELGRLIPAILALLFAADVLTRLLPPERFAFRPHEALRVYRAGIGPYRQNTRAMCPRAYGDLANLANLPEFRQYRAEAASTDALGYRNPKSLALTGVSDILLIGDSFAVGTSVNDDQTLPAVLERLNGRPVYNMASQEDLPPLQHIREVSRRVGFRRGLVLFQHLERKDPPEVEALRGRWIMDNENRAWLQTVSEFSPLRILASRAHRRLQDDRWFPNPFGSDVRVFTLSNGEAMLFHTSEVQAASADHSLNIQYWLALQRELRADGIGLAVMTVPNKLTVYQPLLMNSDRLPPPSSYVGQLTEKLNAAGVPAIDLTAPLAAAAAEEFARGRYVYWRDDTHWNARGIEVAGRCVAEWLQKLH